MSTKKEKLEKRIEILTHKANTCIYLKDYEKANLYYEELEKIEDSVSEIRAKKMNSIAQLYERNTASTDEHFKDKIKTLLLIYTESLNAILEQPEILEKYATLGHYVEGENFLKELNNDELNILENIEIPNLEYLAEISLYSINQENSEFFIKEAIKKKPAKSLFEKLGYHFILKGDCESSFQAFNLAGNKIYNPIFRLPSLMFEYHLGNKDLENLEKELIEHFPLDLELRTGRLAKLVSRPNLDKEKFLNELYVCKRINKLKSYEHDKKQIESTLLFNEARLYIKLGDYDSAINIAEKMKNLNEEELHSAILFNIFCEKRDLNSAKKEMERFESFDSKSVDYLKAEYFYVAENYLECLKLAINSHSKNSFDKFQAESSSITKLFYSKDDVFSYIKRSIEKIGSISTIIDLFEEESKLENNPINFEILTLLYDYKKDFFKSNEHSKNLLKLILNTKEYADSLKNIEERRKYRIMRFATSEFSKNFYIIKGNNKELPLEKEHTRLKHEYVSQLLAEQTLEEILGSENVSESNMKVASPLSLYKDEENALLVSRMLKRNELTPYISNLSTEETTREVKSALKTLAAIQGWSMRKIDMKKDGGHIKISDHENTYRHIFPYFDHMDNLVKRFVGTEENPRFGINKELNNFLDAYKNFIKQDQQYVFVHGDFFKGNIFRDGFIIDFEKACLGDSTLDVAQLLSDPVFKHLDTLDLVEYHFKELFQYMDIDKDLHFSNFRKNFVHCSLGHAGSHLLDGKPESKTYYIQAKLNVPVELATHLDNYSGIRI